MLIAHFILIKEFKMAKFKFPYYKSHIEYEIKDKNIYKEVIYFLGEYSNQEIIFQKEELSDAKLMDFSTAFSALQYDDSKAVLKAANDYLKNI